MTSPADGAGSIVAIDGSRPLRGRLRPVGDKSITHRALIFNALAEGDAHVRHANPGDDPRSTVSCLRALGVKIDDDGVGAWRVRGKGRVLRPATDALDCGNSGTTMRLLAGVCAGQSFTSTLDGDDSLRGRPMRRVAVPLRALGARVEGPSNGERPPLVITGGDLSPGTITIDVASAQVKSCLLLAGLVAGVDVGVKEPAPSRDHTERMLKAMGAPLESGPGWATLGAQTTLHALDIDVPADPSAAALLAGVLAVVPGSDVEFVDLLRNPTRTRFVDVLERAGVQADWSATRDAAGDRVGTLQLRSGHALSPVEVVPDEVPALVDEVPALAAVAAFASGPSVFDGVGELRVKESDRIASMRALLAAFGVETEDGPERLVVHGGTARRPVAELPPTVDHRISMAAAILAAGVSARDGGGPVAVDLTAAVVSHPGFAADLEGLRGDA